MQLRHDDSLGTVDDKGAIFGHERYFAHVNVLLFDVLNRLRRCFLVVDDQAYFDAERAGVGSASQHTFIDIKNRGAKRVIDVFQRRVTTVANNREN